MNRGYRYVQTIDFTNAHIVWPSGSVELVLTSPIFVLFSYSWRYFGLCFLVRIGLFGWLDVLLLQFTSK